MYAGRAGALTTPDSAVPSNRGPELADTREVSRLWAV